MSEQIWTVKALLDWTKEFFTQKKTDAPRLDAEILLAHCLKCQRIELYVRFDEVVEDEVRNVFRSMVKRHAMGEPVAYVVGEREFYSLDFEVNKHVLIPRPETENLVIEALDRITDKEPPVQVADVGSGSGIVAVCLAKYLPSAVVTAVDLSPEALAVAGRNAKRHGVDQNITFVVSDLLSAIPPENQFTVIVSNPPYVSLKEMEEVDSSVKGFEPQLALVGSDSDGGGTTRKLIDQAKNYLVPGGWLLFETSPMLAGSLRKYLQEQESWQDTGIVRDSANLDRIVWARLKA